MGYPFIELSIFLACLVEMIEALTIVLAMGTARQWRSTLYGAGAGVLVLSIFIKIFGTIIQTIPQKWLWMVMGTLLLLFGVQWLRNALLRYSGYKPIHDEVKAFNKLSEDAHHQKKTSSRFDSYAFLVVLKGVFLEGLEVVFIIISFASTGRASLKVGVTSAAMAFILVAIFGILVHRPMARIPENTMKFIVGLVLTTFGTYFTGKGLGIDWPRGQMAFTLILVFYLLISLGILYIFLQQSRGRDHGKAF